MNISEHSSPDIISNLPCNVIESILACLPLRDAVRTSILSTQWKDKWVTLPHLIFNENTFKDASVESCPPRMIDGVEAIKIISQVLLQHNGPVLKFVLSYSQLRSCSAIDHWLRFLCRNGIQELVLEIQTALPHQMPSSFFSCQHLRHLTLSNCTVRPPPTFCGFKKLTSLKFKRVLCSATSLENLIANSPLLEELTLLHMLNLHSLTINAPKLECLWFTGESESLCSINAPCLVLLSLSISQRFVYGERYRSSNMANLLCCLPGTIEQLQLNTYTSQLLEVGNIPKNVPNTFSVLWDVVFCKFSFEDLDSVACALWLIGNAPNLEMIKMQVKTSTRPSADTEPILALMKVNLESSTNLKKLTNFTITSMGGTKPEMEFIKFILATSPVLREVTIKASRAHSSYNGFMMLKELVSFCRASSAAHIIYSDDE